MQNVECCFQINSSCLNHLNHVRTIRSYVDSKSSKKKRIVSTSSESESDCKILIKHFAKKTGNKMYTMVPRLCHGCGYHCGICRISHFCKDCKRRYCVNCAQRCGLCQDWLCDACSEFDECTDCGIPICPRCGSDGLCDSCWENYDYWTCCSHF